MDAMLTDMIKAGKKAQDRGFVRGSIAYLEAREKEMIALGWKRAKSGMWKKAKSK